MSQLLFHKKRAHHFVYCPQAPAALSSSSPAVGPAGTPDAAQALQGYPTSNPHRPEEDVEEQPQLQEKQQLAELAAIA